MTPVTRGAQGAELAPRQAPRERPRTERAELASSMSCRSPRFDVPRREVLLRVHPGEGPFIRGLVVGDLWKDELLGSASGGGKLSASPFEELEIQATLAQAVERMA